MELEDGEAAPQQPHATAYAQQAAAYAAGYDAAYAQQAYGQQPGYDAYGAAQQVRFCGESRLRRLARSPLAGSSERGPLERSWVRGTGRRGASSSAVSVLSGTSVGPSCRRGAGRLGKRETSPSGAADPR
jgi:hypothetical protein